MWTSTLELSPKRVLLTQLFGRFWHGAYFSSFAPLQVQNLPRQPLSSANWVRVRNRLAGVCGSDLHMIYADGDFHIAPAALPGNRLSYPGHEVVGEVIEVGDEVQHLHVGDRVILQSGPNCNTSGVEPVCRACASGNYSLCEQANFLSGPEPIGGGWSEEMLVHEQQLFRISSEMSDEQAVLLEPSAVAIRAVLRRLPLPGEQVLIIGAGTIGLLTLQVIRALVPTASVSVMARYPFQIEQATRLGAAHIIYSQDSYMEVERATGAKLFTGMFNNKMLLGGYEVIYDTVGTKETIHNSLRWTRAGGTIVLAGLNLHRMQLDLTPIWYQEINLIGTLSHGAEIWPIGTHEKRSTFSIAAEMIENEQLHPEKLITHRFSLTDYRTAISVATAKSNSRAIKVVFDFALLPASVVPNVRASARQKRSVSTSAAWPQEQTTHIETDLTSTPEADFIQPPSPPVSVPIEVPLPTSHSSIVEIEETYPFLTEAQIEETPSISLTDQPPFEDPGQTATTLSVISKPRRPRQSSKSQRMTEDIQVPFEPVDNTTQTKLTSDILEE